MGFVNKGTNALIDRDGNAKWVYLDGALLKNITHADTSEHTLTPLELGLPAEAVAILCQFVRNSGTGAFYALARSGANILNYANWGNGLWMISDQGTFRYKLSVANDDWDINGMGYIKQGRVTN